jgi:hypothetical protein
MWRHHRDEARSRDFEQSGRMHAHFFGKDSESKTQNSPTLQRTNPHRHPRRGAQDVCAPLPRPEGEQLTGESGPTLWELLNTFEHTAFRLEVRDRYDEPDEAGSLEKYVAGEPVDLTWMQEWFALVSQKVAAGRRFARVRVVTVPLTDYSRFGMYCATYSNEAGEDIRYLSRDQADAAGLPKHDYWLFDSTTLVRMTFDDNDAFTGSELIDDPGQVVQHNHWRDAAVRYAVGRDDFAIQQALGRS